MKKLKRLVAMIKPTDACNLRCVYCYHSEYQYTNDVMPFDYLEKFIQCCTRDYESLHIIWHGGEPLLPGLEYYKKVIEIENKYKNEIIITNAVQSNGTLYDEEYAEFFSEHQFSIGFSFDGPTNDLSRGLTDKTLKAFEVQKQINKPLSSIKVMLRPDLKNIISLYEYYKGINANVKMSPLFNCALVDENKLLYTPQEYTTAIEELFNVWKNDENCNIRVDPIESYISLLASGQKIECCYASCMTKFLSMDYKGDIYTCSRYFPPEYCVGNVLNYESFSELYDSENFRRIISLAIARRDACKTYCDLFNFCKGGCNHDAFIEGDMSKNNFFSCQVFKSVFPIIRNYFNEVSSSGEYLNPRMKLYLSSNKDDA